MDEQTMASVEDFAADSTIEQPGALETADGGGAPSETSAPEISDFRSQLGSIDDVPEEYRSLIEDKFKNADRLVTSKTQALSEKEKALENERKTYEWAAAFSDMLSTNPAQAVAFVQALATQNGYNPNSQTNTAQEDAQSPNWNSVRESLQFESAEVQSAFDYLANTQIQMLQYLQSMDPQIRNSVGYIATLQQKNEISELKKEFGDDIDEQSLLAAAKANPNVPLRTVYIVNNLENITEKRVQAAIGNKNFKQQVNQPQPGANTPNGFTEPATFEDGYRMALRGITRK